MLVRPLDPTNIKSRPAIKDFVPPKEEYLDSDSGLDDGPVKTLISHEDHEMIDIKSS